jgi:Cu/Ag efflux protein CusF
MKRSTNRVLSAALAVSLPAAVFGAGLEEEMHKMPSDSSHLYPTPEHVDRGMLVEATATVEAIDMDNRRVTIKGPDGRLTTIRVGEEVKNLPQVKVGDKVHISYYEGTVLKIYPPGKEQPALGTAVEAGGVTAAPGEKPGAIAGRVTTATVEIAEVDPYKKTISFRSPDKGYRTVSVKDSHLEHYLKELKAGDVVQAVTTEAVAVAVQPVQSKAQ